MKDVYPDQIEIDTYSMESKRRGFMRRSYLLSVLFLLTLVVLPTDANETRCEVLESVTNRIHLYGLPGINGKDVYRFNLWERYKRSPRSRKNEIVKEMRELATHVAYLDRTKEMIKNFISCSATRSLENDDPQCHRSSIELFEKHCARLSPHTMKHPRVFLDLCDNVAVKTSIEEAFIAVCGRNPIPYGIDAGNRYIDITPKPIHGSSQGIKDVEYCERVSVHGISRMKLQSFAKAYRVTVAPSVVISDKWHKMIRVCFHKNASLGLCQCEKDDWRSIHKGSWSSLMSPYEQRFVDVKFVDGVSGYVTVTLDEVSQPWRYNLLAVGILLLFSSRDVSICVPFYYISSMVIGVLGVVHILIYMGMELLPTGGKTAFYLSMHTSLVSVFLLLLIILLGASLGYWLVRKYIISKDGDVDEGVAQFIKWAIRVIAVTSIFLSSIDTPLAMVAVVSSLGLYYTISSIRWRNDE